MQPENSQLPPSAAEQLAPPPVLTGEQIMSLPPLESGVERVADRKEQAAEASAMVADAIGGATQVAAPPQVQPPQADPQQPATTTANPLVAADEDLIEKEWVDKAKEILEKTKDDPHARTKQVNELQRDYLQKRFGKVIGASE